MIVDVDYLPLPAMLGETPQRAQNPGNPKPDKRRRK
jgi:hypothetical protein